MKKVLINCFLGLLITTNYVLAQVSTNVESMKFNCSMIDYESNATAVTAVIKDLTISPVIRKSRWFKLTNARDVSTMCTVEDGSILTCDASAYALKEGQKLHQVSRSQQVFVTVKIDLADIEGDKVLGSADVRKRYRFGSKYEISCNIE